MFWTVIRSIKLLLSICLLHWRLNSSIVEKKPFIISRFQNSWLLLQIVGHFLMNIFLGKITSYFRCSVKCISFQCVVKQCLLHVKYCKEGERVPQMNGWAKFFWHKWEPLILQLETCRTEIPTDFFIDKEFNFFCNQYDFGKGGLCIKTVLKIAVQLFHWGGSYKNYFLNAILQW